MATAIPPTNPALDQAAIRALVDTSRRNIQLHYQLVAGFSKDSQPYLPLMVSPFGLSRYCYRNCDIGLRISGHLDFLRRKAYPASVQKFGPPFPSFPFQKFVSGHDENVRRFILIPNGQLEFCCFSLRQIGYFYLSREAAEALSQSKRRKEYN